MQKQTPPNRLREVREQHGEKLYDIAALIRRDTSTVWRYEEGLSPVPESVWRTLAAHYEVSVDHLMALDLEPAA